MQKGGISCYSRMAKLFNEQDNIDNSKKCWKRYFEQSEEIEVLEAFYYIIQFIKPNGLTLEYMEKLLSIKEGIIDHALASIEFANEMIEATEGERLMVISMYQENLEYIQLHLE